MKFLFFTGIWLLREIKTMVLIIWQVEFDTYPEIIHYSVE